MTLPSASVESTEPTSATSSPLDPLEDVFGSTPASPAANLESEQGLPDPSDIPRLRSTHITAGYREGIAASKERHIQEGFDEGYALGAEVGLRVGWCLGVLRGILQGLRGDEGGVEDESGTEGMVKKKQVTELLEQAQEELDMRRMFGREYFGEDGIRVYDVRGACTGEEQEGEVEITFGEVADTHPLVKKWVEVVRKVVGDVGLEVR